MDFDFFYFYFLEWFSLWCSAFLYISPRYSGDVAVLVSESLPFSLFQMPIWNLSWTQQKCSVEFCLVVEATILVIFVTFFEIFHIQQHNFSASNALDVLSFLFRFFFLFFFFFVLSVSFTVCFVNLHFEWLTENRIEPDRKKEWKTFYCVCISECNKLYHLNYKSCWHDHRHFQSAHVSMGIPVTFETTEKRRKLKENKSTFSMEILVLILICSTPKFHF